MIKSYFLLAIMNCTDNYCIGLVQYSDSIKLDTIPVESVVNEYNLFHCNNKFRNFSCYKWLM